MIRSQVAALHCEAGGISWEWRWCSPFLAAIWCSGLGVYAIWLLVPWRFRMPALFSWECQSETGDQVVRLCRGCSTAELQRRFCCLRGDVADVYDVGGAQGKDPWSFTSAHGMPT